MWNDIELHCILMDVFDRNEILAFRWLFTPIDRLDRTPMEIIAGGEKETILEILRKRK